MAVECLLKPFNPICDTLNGPNVICEPLPCPLALRPGLWGGKGKTFKPCYFIKCGEPSMRWASLLMILSTVLEPQPYPSPYEKSTILSNIDLERFKNSALQMKQIVLIFFWFCETRVSCQRILLQILMTIFNYLKGQLWILDLLNPFVTEVFSIAMTTFRLIISSCIISKFSHR